MSLIEELQEERDELDNCLQRMKRFAAFNQEFLAELENMNLNEEQKTKLAKMILG